MKKLGIGIFAVTFCFTAVIGIPKIQEVSHLKTEYEQLQKSASQNQSELDDIENQIDSAKNTIQKSRKVSNNPYDFKKVTTSLNQIHGVKINSIDAYNSSSDSGNVLIKTFKSTKSLDKLTSDANLLDYKIKASNINKVVNGINALKLNVVSMAIDKENGTIDLSVKFVGGEE